MDKIKPMEAYRRLHNGEDVEGWEIRGNLITDGKKFYQIQTDEYRVQCNEVPDPDTLPTVEKRRQLPLYYKRICKICGGEFVLSKYNSGRTMCTPCERKYRQDVGLDREKICIRCGKSFYISKYRPYADPQHCPRCANVLRVQKAQKEKLVRDKSTNTKE